MKYVIMKNNLYLYENGKGYGRNIEFARVFSCEDHAKVNLYHGEKAIPMSQCW